VSENLLHTLERLDFSTSIVHNFQKATEVFEQKPDLIILSGGEDLGVNPRRDQFEKSLLIHALDKGIPLIGICRGLQLINVALGGSIRRIEGHLNANHNISGVINGLVNSCHNFGLDSLGTNLEVLAISEDKQVECVKHTKSKLIGVMWHPERDPSGVSFQDLLNRLDFA